MIGRHPECPILTCVHRDPPVGILGDLAEVWRKDHKLGTVMPRFRDEMHIRRACHAQVGAHGNDELRVVPIGAFLNVRLLSPHLGGGWWQIAIPVIETEVDASHQL